MSLPRQKSGRQIRPKRFFLSKSNFVHLVYAVTGFSSNNDGTFDVAVEAKKQAETLPTGQFSDGHDYVHRFCLNIKRALIAARRDGRIPEFPNNDHLPPEERSRKFRLFFVGYFKSLPLWMEVGFYHDAENDRIRVRPQHFEIAMNIHRIGSQALANMMYNEQAVVDPRVANYKQGPRDGMLEYFISYIKACSDPIALEIDPQCKAIGGHIHAAEITTSGVKWLIEPLGARAA